MHGFQDVNHRVVELINEANERKGSKLYLMVYWLWFGADEVLSKQPDFDLEKIQGNHSKMRKLLAIRREGGGNTTIVLFDPETAHERLKKFLIDTFQWQRSRAHRRWFRFLNTHTNNTDAGGDENEVSAIIERYRSDLDEWETERSKTPEGNFNSLHKRDDIPMLLFAAHYPSTRWSRDMIYLGEQEALAVDAETGGFYSEDSKIVSVIISRIEQLAQKSCSSIQ